MSENQKINVDAIRVNSRGELKLDSILKTRSTGKPVTNSVKG